MSKITFIYKGNNFIIHCEKKDKISSVIDGFYNKSLLPRDSVYFICNGDILDNEMTEDQIPFNEQNKKIILVYDYNNQNNEHIIKSNEIICKICKENAKIAVDNYHLILFGCKNNHKINNIKMNELAQTQFINLSKVICEFCKERNKGNSYNNQFYRCLSCKKDICLLCKEKHSSNHNLINHDQKNYVCEEHGEFYHSYCYSCNKNLCTSCENAHKTHVVESFGTMIKDKNILLEENEALRKDIEKLNKVISDIITKLNKVKENFGIYYEIHKSIISNNNKFRNYEILFNINEFNNNTIKKDLETIIKENNVSNQINKIMDIYNKMETEIMNSNKDEKILLYEPDSESDINFNLLNDPDDTNNNMIENNPPSQQNNNNMNNNNINSNNYKNLSKSVEIKEEKKENQNEINKQRSVLIHLAKELQNCLLDEMNKIPLISELIDINNLLKNEKEDSQEINVIKLITTKYKNYRKVRESGNSFYICFIYRLFEFISLNREKTLFEKIKKKILDSKLIILDNGYDWDFLKESYNAFKNEFNTCFEQALESSKACREYIDELFKNDERFSYLNHFIHFCIAAYLKDNKILYEDFIDQDFEKYVQKVEEVGLECTQLEILACANYFDIGIKIEYLYPTKIEVAKFPEDKKGDEIFINILFRPDHYDVLYKGNNESYN